jgi:UDP-N-acetylglucosamine 1-carboxyvinyltransferase
MQNIFQIEGGHRLKGTIAASGNKNAALPLVALSAMVDGPLTLRHLPAIGDVGSMLTLLEEIGIRVDRADPGAVTLDGSSLRNINLDKELAHKLRGSVLLAAPLLARLGQVDLPVPGGDRIGRRRLDTHLLALEQLGATVETGPSGYRIICRGRLQGAEILLDEASVTATENTVMAAALAEGETVIYNAACEPHVQELCRAINACGGNVEGIGTNRIVVEGVESLHGAEITIGPDYIEIGSLIVLAAVTGSDITITGVRHEDLRTILMQFGRLGIAPEAVGPDALRISGEQPLTVTPDFHGAIPKVEDAPWPGFPADLTSIAVVAASQSAGSVMVFEKMFESRLFFVDQLIDMGARIVLCDPHRAVIIGPSPLHGRPIMSPDIRAGMALLIAALAADGVSHMRSIDQIDRGYEQIDERLNALGARIERS